MNAKTVLWISLALGALLLICSPIAWFVFSHLKEGYDTAGNSTYECQK